MNVPLIFGFPAWEGRVKPRVAKKYIYRLSHFIRYESVFGPLKVGDYINDCSGYNGRITELEPFYKAIGSKKRGWYLLDIGITTTNTGCSLIHCGIEPECSRQTLIDRFTISYQWILSDKAKNWYGKNWEKEAEKAKDRLADLQAGGHHTFGPRGEKI